MSLPNKSSFPWLECVAIVSILLGAAYITTSSKSSENVVADSDQTNLANQGDSSRQEKTSHLASLEIDRSIENRIEIVKNIPIETTRKRAIEIQTHRKQVDMNTRTPVVEVANAGTPISFAKSNINPDSLIENLVAAKANEIENGIEANIEPIVWNSKPVDFYKVPLELVSDSDFGSDISNEIETFVSEASFYSQKITLLPELVTRDGKTLRVAPFPIELNSRPRLATETAKLPNIRRLPEIPESESEHDSVHRR